MAQSLTPGHPAPDGQTARRARTRKRLVNAAAELFAADGYGGSSLDMICERAGLTRGAFHYNFSSREELFLALMQGRFDEILTTLSTLCDPGTDQKPGELVETLLGLYSARGHDFIAWSRLNEEFRLHAMHDPEAAAAYIDYYRVVHNQLGVAITGASEAEGAQLVAPADTIAAIVTGTFLQAVSDGILAGLDDADIQSIAIDRMLVILQALMPGAGASQSHLAPP